MKMGAVLNEGGYIIALSRNDIDKAAARIKDTTTINKAFEKNIYIKGYTESVKDRLELLCEDFFALSHEAQERRITAAKDDYAARRKIKKTMRKRRHQNHSHLQNYTPKNLGVSGRCRLKWPQT